MHSSNSAKFNFILENECLKYASAGNLDLYIFETLYLRSNAIWLKLMVLVPGDSNRKGKRSIQGKFSGPIRS